MLSVENEAELIDLIDKADQANIEWSAFYESDLDYELTAIALAPGNKSKELCKGLKLALK